MAKETITEHAMTVGGLRAILAKYADHLPVAFAYPAGDHWRTTLAGPVRIVEAGEVAYTAYHDGFAVVGEDEPTDADRETEWALLLK